MLMSLFNCMRLGLLNMGILKLNEDNNIQVSYLYYAPVDKDKFLGLCRERRMFPILYKAEFQLASKPGAISSDIGARKENCHKNRSILPYDHNRVMLEPTPEFPSDYINASYVDSLIPSVQYIVTQGPLEGTVEDFWRLVWQENVSCIIMVTKCFDFTKKMCYQYWSSHGTGHEETCGVITIRTESIQTLANYTIRKFKIRLCDSEDEIRDLVHFHFTEWPCYTEPPTFLLLEFRRRVKQIVTESPGFSHGKTLVHCNDGGGRSGVYLAVDANLELLEQEGKCDVFGYLTTLRKSRHNLVETESQVKYIYEALEESIVIAPTWFPVSELSQQLRKKSGQDSKQSSKYTEFQQEYQLLRNYTPKYTTGDCAGSFRTENRLKNRDISVITPDNFRPYLTSYQGTLDTDFINAVFVDRYKESKGIIVTEWPQQDTISLFWSLIYDFDVSSIVVLAEPDSPVEYPLFWPNDSKSEMYGPVFTVKQLGRNHFGNIRSWIFEINKKIISLTDLMTGVKAEPKKCQIFQILDWPMGQKTPSSATTLVDLMVTVDRWRERRGGPTVVLSHDGKSRVGLYCAVVTTMEQIVEHGEVDVFTTIRMLRRYRPRIMPSQSEYRCCYNIVQQHVQQQMGS